MEGARLATLAASRANATRDMALPPPGGAPTSANAVYREEEAFASVHDLVHYAIISSPAQR